MSKKDITRRESLKKIAVTAYAAPATVILLTADRATAQSQQVQCSFTVYNNTGGPDLQSATALIDIPSNQPIKNLVAGDNDIYGADMGETITITMNPPISISTTSSNINVANTGPSSRNVSLAQCTGGVITITTLLD